MENLFWKLMTDKEYQRLESLIEDTIGITLNANKKYYLENQLIKRFKDKEISNFESYLALLKYSNNEMTYLIDLVTNTSTEFFRENHHFEYMVKHIIPELLSSKQKIRLWSAGCSTGEEAYSMAVTLFETIPNIDQLDIKILATDINANAIEVARAGLYKKSNLEKLISHKKWFHTIQENNTKKIGVDASIKNMISFRKLNLLDLWPMKTPFDVIFCRNVTIYLSPEAISQIMFKFDKLLEVGGFLILGHSESLNYFQDRYICLGKTIYKKVG